MLGFCSQSSHELVPLESIHPPPRASPARPAKVFVFKKQGLGSPCSANSSTPATIYVAYRQRTLADRVESVNHHRQQISGLCQWQRRVYRPNRLIPGLDLSDSKTKVTGAFADYVQALKEWRRSEKTEHTDRAAIERLLKALAAEAEGKPRVQHEPKRIAGKGAPDFKITRAGMIVGSVEIKQLGENLEKVLKSEQIAK